MPAPTRRRPTRSPPPRRAALAAAAATALLSLALALLAAPASASSSLSSSRLAFLGPLRPGGGHAPTTRRQAAAGHSSSGGGGSSHEKKLAQRLVVDPAEVEGAGGLSFDALIARAHDAALKQELAAPPPLRPPRVPSPAEDREVLEELTGLLYHAINERSTDTMARLWLEDDPNIVFFAGDDGGPVRGYADIVEMLRLVRQEERRLDPARSKGPLMLHPTVEASNFRVVVNGMHAWVRPCVWFGDEGKGWIDGDGDDGDVQLRNQTDGLTQTTPQPTNKPTAKRR